MANPSWADGRSCSYPVWPVGTMSSPYRYHHDAPRQPAVGGADGVIRIHHGLQNTIADLGGFSHIWVLFWCHHARGWNHKVVPPRDGTPRGLFATRAPHRPNPIGLSVLLLRRIDRRELHVGPHDLLDGSPILDIKPYLKEYDSVPDATDGWVAGVTAGAPDHRHWWRDRR